jgi:ribonuclease BN (tRNA processing enzyme)
VTRGYPAEPRGVTVTFAGSGDAFGSGGRYQACIHLRPAGGSPVLLDCGATSLSALKRLGLDPGEISAVFISHLHGDHFGGLPFLILDGQFSRRTRLLAVVGPPGTATRLADTMECLFPGSSTAARRFAVEVTELAPGTASTVCDVAVRAWEADHPSGAPALLLRLDRRDRRRCGEGRPADSRGVLPGQEHPVPPAASRHRNPPGPADRAAHHRHAYVCRHARRPARGRLGAGPRRTDHHPLERAQ